MIPVLILLLLLSVGMHILGWIAMAIPVVLDLLGVGLVLLCMGIGKVIRALFTFNSSESRGADDVVTPESSGERYWCEECGCFHRGRRPASSRQKSDELLRDVVTPPLGTAVTYCSECGNPHRYRDTTGICNTCLMKKIGG